MKLGFQPDYVLDTMEWYEINAALEFEYYAHKDQWETARMLSYTVAQSQSSKRIDFDNYMRFPWDKKTNLNDTAISKLQVEQLKKQAEQYLKNNHNNGG